MMWLVGLIIAVFFFLMKVVGLIIESYRVYKVNRGTYNWDNNWDNW